MGKRTQNCFQRLFVFKHDSTFFEYEMNRTDRFPPKVLRCIPKPNHAPETGKVRPPRPARVPSPLSPPGPTRLTSPRPVPARRFSSPRAVRRVRNRSVLLSEKPLHGTEKRRSHLPGCPSGRDTAAQPPGSRAPRASPPGSRRTITNYRRAQRAAANHRLRRP